MGGLSVFVSFDLEGVAGVDDPRQLRPGESAHRAAVSLLAGELAAALAGAREGGAVAIVLADGHADGRNLPPEEVPAEVRLQRGSLRPFGMLDGARGADLAFFLGYHARAGSRGVLAHTYTFAVARVELNGTETGELGLNAALLAWWGVPLALVTGDDVLRDEAASLRPPPRLVTVKEAVSPRSARHLSTAETRERIREAAREAVANPPLRPRRPEGPFEMMVEFSDPSRAAAAMLFPGAVAAGPRGIRFGSESLSELYRSFRARVLLAEALAN